MFSGFTEKYDVVVVGAGHAGCEAAMAAARMGLKTALYTINLDLIAQMSCNPAVGGIAKGHLVREIDALGGVMGEVIDAVGIQFRLLNTSRGPAVWSPRAQADKKQYRAKMRQVLESEPNLRIKQAEVVDLLLEDSVGAVRDPSPCLLESYGRQAEGFGPQGEPPLHRLPERADPAGKSRECPKLAHPCLFDLPRREKQPLPRLEFPCLRPDNAARSRGRCCNQRRQG